MPYLIHSTFDATKRSCIKERCNKIRCNEERCNTHIAERIYIIFAIFVDIRVNCWYDEWWWLIVYYNDDDYDDYDSWRWWCFTPPSKDVCFPDLRGALRPPNLNTRKNIVIIEVCVQFRLKVITSWVSMRPPKRYVWVKIRVGHHIFRHIVKFWWRWTTMCEKKSER